MTRVVFRLIAGIFTPKQLRPGYPCLSGTRVSGSDSASTASHPVGYPVPNFEAGVQL